MYRYMYIYIYNPPLSSLLSRACEGGTINSKIAPPIPTHTGADEYRQSHPSSASSPCYILKTHNP